MEISYIYRISNKKMSFSVWFLVFGIHLLAGLSCGQDPCYTYTRLNDTTMTIGFELGPAEHIICDQINPGWYRYTGSIDGLMTSQCPDGRQCGTDSQVWMSGKIPSYYDGIQSVDICIRHETDCCDQINQIDVKNCNSYIVYNLVIIPTCTRYCFNESSDSLVTVSTTSTTTTLPTRTEKSTHSAGTNDTSMQETDSDGLSAGALAGIIVSSVLGTILIVGGVVTIYIYVIKTNINTMSGENIRRPWSARCGINSLSPE